ncbi:MAG: 30S ribosome-binding factor RbfA [Cellvibrionaceae bacterium]
MPKEFSRNVRVADQIQRSLAQLIQSDIADPRLGLVNINDVDVSRDYANARVYVTFVGGEEETDVAESIAILNKAAGYLRRLLAKSLNSRTTPRLSFVYDKTSVDGQKLSHLIDQAITADRNRS